jgi:glutathione peroxidase
MKPTPVLILILAALAGALIFFSNRSETAMKTATAKCPEALNFTVKSIDEEDVSLCRYAGNVVLIVNTASECGYTPQYKDLEELNQRYHSRGVRILGFPSNDFGAQEPGSNTEIKEFCETRNKLTFDMFAKIPVLGKEKHELYRYLTSGGGDQKLAGEVAWNFNKYLIGKDGKLVGRFLSPVEPLSEELIEAIERELEK